MKTQVSQLELFVQMAKAMEQGNTRQLKKADKLIRRTLKDNKARRDVSNGIFTLSEEEASIFNKMKLTVR